MNEETTVPMDREEEAEFRTAAESKLWDRYGLYVDFNDDQYTKSYDEWLNS